MIAMEEVKKIVSVKNARYPCRDLYIGVMAVITAWFYGHLAYVNVHHRVIGIILFKLKNVSVAT